MVHATDIRNLSTSCRFHWGRIVFAQDAAAINVKEQHCCVLGDLPKRVVVTPDVDSLLEAIENI